MQAGTLLKVSTAPPMRQDGEMQMGECGERYTINVLNYLKTVLIDKAMGRHEDNSGLWIAVREVDDIKDYIMAGGKLDSWKLEALRRRVNR